jgi:hypothetical protein
VARKERMVVSKANDRMDQSRPSTHRQHDRPPSSPTDETAEQDTPYTEAPAAAGR